MGYVTHFQSSKVHIAKFYDTHVLKFYDTVELRSQNCAIHLNSCPQILRYSRIDVPKFYLSDNNSCSVEPLPTRLPEDGTQKQWRQRRREKKKVTAAHKKHRKEIGRSHRHRDDKGNILINLQDQKPKSANGYFR